MEEQIRITAIDRFKQGEAPNEIYTSLKRSKKWFFKWLKRYRSGDKNWFKDQSRAPRKSPQRISEAERQRCQSETKTVPKIGK